ncbi:MAG: hypothetical protein OHK0029_32790 [Armatimonadaceae bacterium]
MNEIRKAVVTAVRQLTPHVREIEMESEGEPLNFAPGQWLSLRLPVSDKPPLNRAYSLADAPQASGKLVLCFDRIPEGLGSNYLWEVEPGTTLEFTGPHGNFVLPEESGNLLFVARYTGIVPFRAMLMHLSRQANPPQVMLVYSSPGDEETVYREELRLLSSGTGWFQMMEVPEGHELGTLEVEAEALRPFTPFVCGTRFFTRPVRAFLMDRFGFERRAVQVENFN